jgi:hypothetical protein
VASRPESGAPRPESGAAGPERFKLLASAIAGRLLEVAPVQPPDAPAWTDGSTVYIDLHARTSEQRRAVAVQASLVAAGSLAAEFVDVLARRPALTRRYLAVEGHRALAAHETVLPDSVRSVIDREIAAHSESPAGSLAIATSRVTIHDPPAVFGTIRPRAVDTATEQSRGTSSPARHVPRARPGDVLRELDDDEDDGRPVVDFISSPIGGGGAIGRLLKKMFGDARSSSGGPPGADAPTHWTRRGTRGRATATTTVAVPIAAMETDEPRRGTIYPEWDVHRRRYRPEWCTVVETTPIPTKPLPLPTPDVHALRRALSRLGMELERRGRQLQGIDIDIDAAVESCVDRIAGAAPDDGVYIDTLRLRRDLAVLLLLDVSGSAGEPSPLGGTVHEHQRDAAAALAVALDDLGDRVALYTFCSQGRSAVQVAPLKRFRDHLDTLVMQRLNGCVPGAYTRLGAAIRHGGAVLERDAGTPRRLLVVLSDGFAYDHGYEGTYGEADARRALAETRRRGTGCLCLSVGAATDAGALRRVFGTAAHAVVPRTEQLPGVIGPLFRFAIRSADAQRRIVQRRVRTRERLEMERRSA